MAPLDRMVRNDDPKEAIEAGGKRLHVRSGETRLISKAAVWLLLVYGKQRYIGLGCGQS